LRYLWHGDYAAITWDARAPTHTPVYAVSVVMIFVGLLAFVVVLVRAV
jgi:hypothetical protein